MVESLQKKFKTDESWTQSDDNYYHKIVLDIMNRKQKLPAVASNMTPLHKDITRKNVTKF